MIPTKIIRAILLFGNLKPIFDYFKTIHKIKHNALHDSNPFVEKKLESDILTAKEGILYGKKLSTAQKKQIKILKEITSTKIIESIYLGQYVKKNGAIKFNPFKEIPLCILALASSMLNIFWLAGLTTIVIASNIPALYKIGVISIFLIPIGIYTYFIWSHLITPIHSYIKLTRPQSNFLSKCL